MRTSVLRRQSKRLSHHSDLRAVAAASKPMDKPAPPDSPPACNFPEILARDLEMSEATFLAKSMTAGAPIRSLATPPPEKQKRQALYVSVDEPNPRVHWGDALSKTGELAVIEETSYHSDSSDNVTTPSEVASLTSDSGTDSGPDMEPPSVYRRQQSVCTAATSLMAHCLSPNEKQGLSLFALEENYQGQSWIDLDMEDSEDDEQQGEAAQIAPIARAIKQTHESDIAVLKDSAQTASPPIGCGRPFDSPSNGFSSSHPPPLDRVLASLPHGSLSCERPHTSPGEVAQEHPRLASVSYSHLRRKRSSSLQNTPRVTSRSLYEFERRPTSSWDSAATTLASQASAFQHEIISSETNLRSSVRRSARYQAIMSGKRASSGTFGPAPSNADIAEHDGTAQDEIINDYLAHDDDTPAAELSCENSVMASERMSRDKLPPHIADELQDSEQQPASHPPDTTATQPSQDIASEVRPNPPIPADSAISNDSSIVTTFFRSKIDHPDASSPPAVDPVYHHPPSPSSDRAPVNMRLHPDVFDRLEASVTGFPDTMLSTRALPIDIIRSLPKKTHRYSTSSSSSLSQALEQPDLAPVSSKWHISSLRRRDAAHISPPPPPPPSSSSPPASLPTAAQPTPAAIIQAIFPTGSALHCDSLYAHLVAYNYITSLCGPDTFFTSSAPSPMVTSPSTLPSSTRGSRNLMHRLSPNTQSAAIPRKASMLLGMDKTTPTSALTSTTEELDHKPSRLRSLFKTSSSRRARENKEGEMIPARHPTSGRSRPVTERDVRDVQAGLLRCVRILVAKLKSGASTGEPGVEGDDEEEGVGGRLREDEFEIDADGWRGLDPWLLRSLVEVVRGAEERMLSAGA